MTILSPNHNYAADECIAHMHIPTLEEKIRASESFDKTVLVAGHQAALHDAYILEMATHPLNALPVTPVSPTSSIGGLKVVSLKQLKIGKVHRNRVVRGTLCMKALCTKGLSELDVVNVFEDEEGSATPICLRNALKENHSSAHAQRIYPQGSRVAVREPYLTRFPDGELGLLVEKLADLVFLWVPEVTESVPEIHTSNGEERTPSKEKISELENGDHVSGNCDAFVCDGSNGQTGTVESIAAGVVANGAFDSGHGEERSEESVGENAGRDLSFEEILAFRGETKRAVAKEDADEEVKQFSDDGGVSGEVTSGVEVAEEAQTDLASAEVVAEDAESAEADLGSGVAAEKEVISGAAGVEDPESAEAAEKIEEEIFEAAAETEKAASTGAKAAAEEAFEVADAGAEEETEVVVVEEQTTKAAGDGGETCVRLRMRGNEYFARAEYKLAADMYTRAAEKARREERQDEEQLLALSNRAEAWLRMERSGAALEDAEAVLGLLVGGGVGGVAKAKALFRKGRALMGLRRYGEAMSVLELVLEAAPADRQLREAATTCGARLKHLTKPGKRQRAALSKRQQR